MNNEQNEKMELNLDELEKVAGGAGMLEELITSIKRDGHFEELKTMFKTQGKKVTSAKCCGYYPELCAFCATAVAML